MSPSAFSVGNAMWGLVIAVNVATFVGVIIMKPPRRVRCGCGAKMSPSEPVRKDVILAGMPAARITTTHTCPKCGSAREVERVKRLALYRDRDIPFVSLPVT